MRSYSHLSDDERGQIAILRAAGRSMGAHCPGARSGENRELQRNALSSGGYSQLHAAGAYQLRRRREAILEREAALRLFVGDRLAEGWTPDRPARSAPPHTADTSAASPCDRTVPQTAPATAQARPAIPPCPALPN